MIPVIVADAVLDAGDRDFGNGLLLMLDAAVREVSHGGLLEVRGGGVGVDDDLGAWCEITGNALVGPRLVRRGRVGDVAESAPPPLGSRLWLYTNFDCNLACDYCCAASSAVASARLLPVDLAVEAARQLAQLGGREIFMTGGEPFLHPQVADLVAGVAAHLPVTILTNAMVMSAGRRRRALEAFDRDRVVLQVSLDSVAPEIHDRHRGQGAHARAVAGIALCRELGFRVRVAATLSDADAAQSEVSLRSWMAEAGVADEDRVIRRIARQGVATAGVVVTRDDLHPEPAVAVDGVWWHPVAIADPSMRLAVPPLPIAAVLEEVQRALDHRAARGESVRRAFRCA